MAKVSFWRCSSAIFSAGTAVSGLSKWNKRTCLHGFTNAVKKRNGWDENVANSILGPVGSCDTAGSVCSFLSACKRGCGLISGLLPPLRSVSASVSACVRDIASHESAQLKPLIKHGVPRSFSFTCACVNSLAWHTGASLCWLWMSACRPLRPVSHACPQVSPGSCQ